MEGCQGHPGSWWRKEEGGEAEGKKGGWEGGVGRGPPGKAGQEGGAMTEHGVQATRRAALHSMCNGTEAHN